MGKRKVVFNAETQHLTQIQALVRAGRYASASEFLRDAIDEKLATLGRAQLAEQVARYCTTGHADEDEGLIAAQAIDEDP